MLETISINLIGVDLLYLATKLALPPRVEPDVSILTTLHCPISKSVYCLVVYKKTGLATQWSRGIPDSWVIGGSAPKILLSICPHQVIWGSRSWMICYLKIPTGTRPFEMAVMLVAMRHSLICRTFGGTAHSHRNRRALWFKSFMLQTLHLPTIQKAFSPICQGLLFPLIFFLHTTITSINSSALLS